MPTAGTPAATPDPVIPFSGVVPAGTYAWTSFEPNLTLVIPAGWQVGHRHADYFDLFPASATSGGGPGVGFGRFRGVFDETASVPMTSSAAVLDVLGSRTHVALAGEQAAELLGLSGIGVEIRADAAQTPLFDGEGGAFKFDPGWVCLCRFLDVEGGVLLVGVFSPEKDAAAGLLIAQPLLDGVSVAP